MSLGVRELLDRPEEALRIARYPLQVTATPTYELKDSGLSTDRHRSPEISLETLPAASHPPTSKELDQGLRVLVVRPTTVDCP